ncbi:MAG: hypothetical protein ACQSGP_21515 [Frankia sp.]
MDTAVEDKAERNRRVRQAFDGAERIHISPDRLDDAFRAAMMFAMPVDALFACKVDDDQAWVMVSRPGTTRDVVRRALAIVAANPRFVLPT